MATKPKFLASMGYHIFLIIVLSASAPSARGEVCYESTKKPYFMQILFMSVFSPAMSQYTELEELKTFLASQELSAFESVGISLFLRDEFDQESIIQE